MARRVIVSNLMSIDGFFEDTKKSLDWVVIEDEFFHYARRTLREVDTLLFGRKTYEHMALHWPQAPKDEIADKMNGLPKIVFTNSLKKAEWANSTIVAGDAAKAVEELKAHDGKDMVIFGSAELTSALLQKQLIDEYRVVLNPVLLGSGTPLFAGGSSRLPFRLANFRRFASGVAVLYYRPMYQGPTPKTA